MFPLDGIVDPTTTRGDIIVRGASGLARLALPANGSSLGSNGTDVVAVAPIHTVNNFRLTLTSGTAVTVADVTGATTVYLTPYNGSLIGLYDGTNWQVISSAEVSLALGTLTSGLPYDVFAYNNSGTLTLELLAWTNGTTRATALVRQNGVWCKTGALTRRYVGTFYTTSTTATEDSLAKRFLFNASNRRPRPMYVKDATGSWTYSSAVWRQANANTANQLAFVRGLDEDGVEAIAATAASSGVAGSSCYVGVGLDGAGASGQFSAAAAPDVNYLTSPAFGFVRLSNIGIGYHALWWSEFGNANTITFYGGSNGCIEGMVQA